MQQERRSGLVDENEAVRSKKRLRSGSFGLGSGERLRAGQASSCLGLGNTLHFCQEDFKGQKIT